MPINNEIYSQQAGGWWDENHFLHLLKTGMNPPRFGYFHNALTRQLGRQPEGLSVLDVGCGGGILSEEFAKIGCRVTGLDPSAPSLETARKHAAMQGLTIDYRQGSGEKMPFKAGQRRWRTSAGGDSHDLWIDPTDNKRMMHANDGGGAVTSTGAAPWTANDFPTAEDWRIELPRLL